MENLEYLFAGFAVFWAALFLYLLLLQARLRSLHRDIEQLEERLAQGEEARPPTASRTTTTTTTTTTSRTSHSRT